MEISDNELLGLFVKNNDQAAFEQLIRRHSSMVLGVCQNMLWNQADAEDVFQSVFLLLSKKAPRLLRHNSVGGWLHETAVRTSLRRRRNIQRKREVIMVDDQVVFDQEPWQTIAAAQQGELLHREIARLPKRYRDVIVLCHLEGKSRSEAAETLDCTTASVKAALARGRKMLRQRLMGFGVSASSALGITSVGVAESCVTSEVLIQSTVQHCQGLTPDFGVGTGADIVCSLAQKEAVAMTMGIVKSSLTMATGLVAVGAMSLAAIANSATIGPAVLNVEIPLQVEQENAGSNIEVAGPGKQDSAVTATGDQSNMMTDERYPKLSKERDQLIDRLGEGHPLVVAIKDRLALENLKRKGFLPDTARSSGMSVPEMEDRMNFESLKAKGYIPADQKFKRNAASALQLKIQLVELQLELEKMQQTFGSQHAKVVEKKRQIQLLTELAEKAEETPAQKSEYIPYRLVELETAKSRLGSGHPEIKKIENEIQALEQLNTQGNALQIELSMLHSKLESANQKFAANHPSVVALENQIGLLKRYIKLSEQKVAKIGDQAMEIASPIVSDKKLLMFLDIKPRHSDAEYTMPVDLSQLVLEQTEGSKDSLPGFELISKDGKQLRRFVDFNRDGMLDRWIYFKDGVESYRDIDRNFDAQADESQYTSGDEVRIGFDKDQDGVIDSWENKRLSDMRD